MNEIRIKIIKIHSETKEIFSNLQTNPTQTNTTKPPPSHKTPKPHQTKKLKLKQ